MYLKSIFTRDKDLKLEIYEDYISKNKEAFYKIAYNYAKNQQDSLDIVQEAIYKGLKNINKLKEPQHIKAWFYKILINTAIDYIKKNRKYLLVEDISIIDEEEHTDCYEDIDLKRALEELPYKYKSIVILRYFEDMKIEEIASILDINVNTVKTRLYKGLGKLKIKLDE